MGKMYLQEAFKKLEILEEEDFNLTDEGSAEEMKDFLNDDTEDDTIEVIDDNAEDEEELEDSYIGKVILECEVCHSMVYKDPEEVEIDEELANVDEECPFCYSTDGFKVIGQVEPYTEGDDWDVEVTDKEPTEEPEVSDNDGEDDVDIDINVDNFDADKDEEPKKKAPKKESLKSTTRKTIRESVKMKPSHKRRVNEADDLGKKLFKEFKILVDGRVYEVSHTKARADEIVDILKKSYPDSEIVAKPYNHYASGGERRKLQRLIDAQNKEYGVTESLIKEEDELTDRQKLRRSRSEMKGRENNAIKQVFSGKNYKIYEPIGFDGIKALGRGTNWSVTHPSEGERYYDMYTDRYGDFYVIVDKGFTSPIRASKNPMDKILVLPKSDNGMFDSNDAPVDAEEFFAENPDIKEFLVGKGLKEALSDDIRKNRLKHDDELDAEYAEDGDTHVQFQDRMSNTDEYGTKKDKWGHDHIDRKLNKHPKTASRTWGRVWKDGELKKSVEGSKYGTRQELAKYLDNGMNESHKARMPKKSYVTEGYRGSDVEYRSNGPWADSDLIRNGKVFNYWDIEDALWDMFLTYSGYENTEETLRDPEIEKEFDEFVQDTVDGYLDDVEYGGYFNNRPNNSWHDDYIDHDIEESCGGKKKSKKKSKEEELDEDLNNIELDTDDQHISISATEKEPTGDEMIAPIEPEIKDEIENNEEDMSSVADETEEPDLFADTEEGEDVDVPMDEFDEESFDQFGESYLRNVYDNVESFKTVNARTKDNRLTLEGVIRFKSGNEKKTSFVFESKDITRSGKMRLQGMNEQISRGKKSFTITGRMNGNKFVTESFNYNYRAKNESGKSQRVYGTLNESVLKKANRVAHKRK